MEEEKARELTTYKQIPYHVRTCNPVEQHVQLGAIPLLDGDIRSRSAGGFLQHSLHDP